MNWNDINKQPTMHTKYFFLSVIFLPMIFGSCNDDLLESTPYGQSTSANFWRNADDAVAAANALYEPLLSEDFYGHAEHTFEIPSDDQYRAGDHGEDQAIEELTYSPDNPQLAFSWKPKYEIISRANAILINVPDIEMDQTLKNRTLGEAYFMRGFMYWRQYVIYGEVPIILEEDVLQNNFNKPKATINELEAQIESDLMKAVDLLPLTHDDENLGRPTKGSAWGLMTKLYVYQEQFADAIAMGNQVISGPYPLADNFLDNFSIASENNPEVLFSAQCKEGWIDAAHIIYTTPRPWGGWDFHEPTQNLVDEFEVDDPRLDYTVFLPGEMVDLGGDLGLTEYTSELSLTGYHFH
jgi:hypothetical protein